MQYTKILRWAVLGGLCLAFFVPFVVANGSVFPDIFNVFFPVNAYFPFITGKNFVFRILVEILLGLYVLLALREPKYRPRSSYILWALLAFVAWMGVATIFSLDPIKSFWSNFERMDGYITLLHLFVYFVILGAVVEAEQWWERMLQCSILASVLMGLYALFQIAGVIPIDQGGRLDGTLGNATYMAVFMLFNLFFTLFLLVRYRRSVAAQALYGIALVLQFIGLFETETRGALLGLVGGLIIGALWIVWRARRQPQWRALRKVSLGTLGVIVVLIIAFFALKNTAVVQKSATLNRVASISLTDPTTQARFLIWHMAYQGFVQSPKTMITGWGQENFDLVFNKYYNPAMYDQEQWFDRAHNQFLDWLIAGGLPAFVLYISLFILAAWAIIASDALSVPEQAAFLGLLAAYAFNNLFVFDNLSSAVYFFLTLAFAHALSQKKLPRFMALSRPASDKAIAMVAPLVIVGVALGAWALNAPGIVRAQTLVNAIETQVGVADASGNVTAQPKDPSQNLAEFQSALGRGVWPGGPLGQQEVTEQLWQFASQLPQSSTSVDPAVEQSIDTLAQSAGQKMLAQRPHDARLELFDGTFLQETGQYPQALPELQAALADSPEKQQIMFQIGVLYINANDFTDALTIIKKAFDEAPAYTDARVLYASALYYAGDTAQGDALLTQGFGTVLVDNDQLLQVYTNTKMYSRVEGIWKARIAKDPTNLDNYVGLAEFYFGIADTADTLTELQAAIKADPSAAAQIQPIITQIQSGALKPPAQTS